MTDAIKSAISGDWLTKGLLALITALMVWFGSTVQELAVKSAVQAEAMNGIKTDIAAMSIDRYTGSQAKADQALVAQRLSRLEDWTGNLSERLRSLEDDVRGNQP